MRYLFLLLAMLCSCGQHSPKSEWQEGEQAVVSRVMDGDTFALNTGQVVRLVGIEAPSFAYRDRAEMPYAEKAKRELENLVLGETVQLYYPGLTRDRYDRALAQAYVLPKTGKPIWVNEALVQRGAAWVRLYPDTSKGSDQLWQAEDQARDLKRGMWGLGEAPTLKLNAKSLPDRVFIIIEGEPASSTKEDGICQTTIPHTAGNIIIQHELLDQNSACLAPATRTLEVRGWIREGTIRDNGLNIRQFD